MRAMVVDDSRAMRSILKRLLAECGFDEVVEASDGPEALTRLGSEAERLPELVLVDAGLPVMTGAELVRAVRADAAHAATVIMMITKESAVDEVADALAAGANEYVTKPFTKDVLLDKLELLRPSR